MDHQPTNIGWSVPLVGLVGWPWLVGSQSVGQSGWWIGQLVRSDGQTVRQSGQLVIRTAQVRWIIFLENPFTPRKSDFEDKKQLARYSI